MKHLFLTWCAVRLSEFLGGICDQSYSLSEDACLKESMSSPGNTNFHYSSREVWCVVNVEWSIMTL